MSEFELRRRLREFRGAIAPERDLWPGIAGGLDGVPATQHAAAGHEAARVPFGRHGRPALLAMAAVVLLGSALLWRIDPFDGTGPVPEATVAELGPETTPQASPLQREAQALTLEYLAALHAMGAAGLPSEAASGLAELDAGAAQIRAALEQDAGAVYLVDRLRDTYTQRLRLTQRVLAG
ncbi:MAG TPA: hypothetical protein VFG21_00015 [Xanthomonadaceae bacterium]|nr:hypothetical protein [Xanthomonadaceae bacterium]